MMTLFFSFLFFFVHHDREDISVREKKRGGKGTFWIGFLDPVCVCVCVCFFCMNGYVCNNFRSVRFSPVFKRG